MAPSPFQSCPGKPPARLNGRGSPKQTVRCSQGNSEHSGPPPPIYTDNAINLFRCTFGWRCWHRCSGFRGAWSRCLFLFTARGIKRANKGASLFCLQLLFIICQWTLDSACWGTRKTADRWWCRGRDWTAPSLSFSLSACPLHYPARVQYFVPIPT